MVIYSVLCCCDSVIVSFIIGLFCADTDWREEGLEILAIFVFMQNPTGIRVK